MAVDVEELRFAVTMNGGVSLAVYIGGVAQELNLISKARPFPGVRDPDPAPRLSTSNPYNRILRLLRYTQPYIDVLTGTSAGGINAAALALAQSNVDGDIAMLKPLWFKQAQIEDLLRRPFQAGAPSLMKGDDHFLPLLEEAFKGMAGPRYRRDDRDVDLTMTTTLLKSVVDDPQDELGTAIVEHSYAGQFRFRGDHQPRAGDDDHFHAGVVAETARALALASRASAGFPVAFEPTFIPVDDKSNHGRIDMGPFAEWRKDARKDKGGNEIRVPASRYGVDGGVLNNTPTLPALRGIQQRRARERFVRRVLILVHPHAEDPAKVKDEFAEAEKPPTLVSALVGLLQAATSTGSHAYVREIEIHNESAIRLRDSRALAMKTFNTSQELRAFLTTPAWELFRSMRKERNAVFMANAVYRVSRRSMPVLKEAARSFLQVQDEPPRGLPFIPPAPPGFRDGQQEGWPWGIALATGLTAHIVQMMREVGRENGAASTDDAAAEVFSAAVNCNIEIDRLGEELEKAARKAAESAKGDLENKFGAYLDEYRIQLETAAPEQKPTTGDLVRGLVWRCVSVFYRAVVEPQASRQTLANRDVLGGALLHDCGNEEELLLRLLSVEIVAYMVRENTVGGATDDYVELVQLNARTPQDIARDIDVNDKLAGTELARFSAFFKESWRANDWIWGRLDAARTLMQVVLTVESVKRASPQEIGRDATDAQCDRVVGRIARSTFSGNGYTAVKGLLPRALLDDARKEVRGVLNGTWSGRLDALPSLAAYGIQVSIMAQEVEDLRAAIESDDARGALGIRSAALVAVLDQLAANPEIAQSQRAFRQLEAFACAKIGGETMAEELPSDALIRTMNTAVATAATVLTSPRSGLKLATPLTKGIRGVVAVPYWLINGLTQRGQMARIAAASLLALGASLVLISLLVPLKGFLAGLVPVIGIGSLLALVVYGAMRTRSLVHVAALTGLFIPLLLLGANRAEPAPEVSAPKGAASNSPGLEESPMGWFAVACLVVIVVGIVVMANISVPARTPLAFLSDVLPASWARRSAVMGSVVIAACGSALAVLVWVCLQSPIWHQLRADPLPSIVFNGVVYLVIVLAGAGMSLWFSRRCGVPTKSASPERLSDPTGVAIAWTGVYGAVYVMLTWILTVALEGRTGWVPVAAWLSLGLAVTFSLVVPLVLGLRYKPKSTPVPPSSSSTRHSVDQSAA